MSGVVTSCAKQGTDTDQPLDGDEALCLVCMRVTPCSRHDARFGQTESESRRQGTLRSVHEDSCQFYQNSYIRHGKDLRVTSSATARELFSPQSPALSCMRGMNTTYNCHSHVSALMQSERHVMRYLRAAHVMQSSSLGHSSIAPAWDLYNLASLR
jgi:hypothetical protein